METLYRVRLFRVIPLLGHQNTLVKRAYCTELSDAREIFKLWAAQLEKRGRKTEGTSQYHIDRELWCEETWFFYKGLGTHYIVIDNKWGIEDEQLCEK